MFSCPLHSWYSKEEPCPICFQPTLITEIEFTEPTPTIKEGEDELWNYLWGKLVDIIQTETFYPATEFINYLKENYTITKK